MNDVEISVLEYNNKKYYLVDEIEGYSFLSNIEDNKDILVFKNVDDNMLLVNNGKEKDYAFYLFYQKYNELV